ncbi:MAG: flagellar protein export ATPase FliI [Candidatus Omnitrophica bacterium]|nr:flagellar protein export ATPase FliI [Candidatus Omnitrophota bacterium]MBD3269879.1 flagellar protein export ATPase FliI [Candidatus Omnitrophota bacterium]
MNFDKYYRVIESTDPVKLNGKVTRVIGLVIESEGPAVGIGEICHIYSKKMFTPLKAEVVGFKGNKVLLMPLGEMAQIEPKSEVVATGGCLEVKASPELLGRVLGGLGNPIDGKAPIVTDKFYPVTSTPPHPLARSRIKQPISTGIRSIDGLLTLGKGQRIGIFSGSGIGKSVLMGMIARYTSADVNVIALIGERGREVRDFIEKDLGAEGLKRSVVVVSTSDQPALIRVKGAQVATAIAEYFRDQGLNVMFMMDSVTRFAMAQREIGLAIGEPPATKGYTPSVFALLPKLLERSGAAEEGSITGAYTVLVEADDMNEPVADTVRSILDGHIVLSRELAASGHYPPIDVLSSISRLMIDIVDSEHYECASRLRDTLVTYRDSRDLVNIGAYVKGSNHKIDYALGMLDEINKFLRQRIEERAEFNQTAEWLKNMFQPRGT